MDIDNRLAGKTIEKAEVDGHGILIHFRDGSVLSYWASDGEHVPARNGISEVKVREV